MYHPRFYAFARFVMICLTLLLAECAPAPTAPAVPLATALPTSTITRLPTNTNAPAPTSTPTVSPLLLELLQPGRIVKHAPTPSNLYSWYSYFPNSAIGRKAIVLGVWPHGANMMSEDYAYHEKQAEISIAMLKPYSEKYQIPIVVVAMPRVARLYVHSLHPGTFTTNEEMLRRPDLKLIDAVWNQYIPSMKNAGLETDGRVLMLGFSSPAMFAHRFTMIHPERVKAVWLGATAPAPLPASELLGHSLDYPLGVRNLEALSGKPFDFQTYKQVPHLVRVGENDTVPNNDTTNGRDIFSKDQRLYIRANFGDTNPKRIQFFHDFLVSVGMNSTFKIYPGVGHQNSPMLDDAFRFLLNASQADSTFGQTPTPILK